MTIDLLFISLCTYNIASLTLIALVVFYVLIPRYNACSPLNASHAQILSRLCMFVVVSGLVGLSSRSLYLKYSVEQFQARPTNVSTSAWAFGTLLTEVAAHVFGSETRYLLGLQGYLALIAWAVYMNVEGSRRNIPHLWLFLLLTPIVSFAFAQTLFHVALLLTNSEAGAEENVREINLGFGAIISNTMFHVILYPYLFACFLPYAYGTGSFLWVFLVAYATPLILTYLPLRRDNEAAIWKLISISSVLLYSIQLGIAAFSHTKRNSLWTLSDLGTILYDLQWSWVAHPVTRALGYDLCLSAVVLVYWSSIKSRAISPGITAAGLVKNSGQDMTNHKSDATEQAALPGYGSAAIVALTIVAAGLGAASASVYRA